MNIIAHPIRILINHVWWNHTIKKLWGQSKIRQSVHLIYVIMFRQISLVEQHILRSNVILMA